jgi:hypothetical protein
MNAENRLYTFTFLELLVLVSVSVWQIYYVRRLVLKRRML